MWITRIHVCTNGILWIASCSLLYLAHCSKYCWLNCVFVQGSEFGLAAMAEVVVERPETIFIGAANRVAKEVEHVWRYKLTVVGAERMYVCLEPPSTTHAGDCMFIMEEVVEGQKWYVAYEGRPVSNGVGEQELEKRAAVFRTSASFWEDGVHEWETNNIITCGAGPPMQKWRKNRSGEHLTSWFAHAMRCSCGTSNSFAFLDSTAFWRGGLMHGSFLTFDRHQVVNGHQSEANIEFAELLLFLCSCGCRWVLFLERQYQETCMFCLLCLVAVAELRHLEMVCARLYPVLYVNMYICKMYRCIHRSR